VDSQCLTVTHSASTRPCFSIICLTVDPCHCPVPERVGTPSALNCWAIFFQLTPWVDSLLARRERAATRLGGGGGGGLVSSATGGRGVSESATTSSPVGLSVDSPVRVAGGPGGSSPVSTRVDSLVMVESIASTRLSRVESSATVSVSL
jgi:hypothetical protein